MNDILLSKLTDVQIEVIYRYQKNKYQLEDAKAHFADYNENGDMFPRFEPDKKDYQDMVDAYNKQHDCNIAENDLWASIIEDYFVEI